jgi:hypothetical protein
MCCTYSNVSIKVQFDLQSTFIPIQIQTANYLQMLWGLSPVNQVILGKGLGK